MTVVDFLSGFLPLTVVVLIGYGVTRVVRGARAIDDSEPGDLARQLVLYGLLFATMTLTASGATWVFGELTSTSGRTDNSGLAQALAFVALGLPAFTALLFLADGRLRSDPHEAQHLSWSAYLNVALATALIVAMVGAYRVIRDGLDAAASIDGADVLMAVLWASLWALHWFVLRSRHGIRGDVHRAVASIVGIVTLGIGNVGLIYVLCDRAYTEITGDPVLERAGPSNNEWAALFAIGIATWIFFWLADFEPATRSEAWYVTVVPAGALPGFVTLLSGGARVLYLLGVWVVGDREQQAAVRHFDELPFLLALVSTGGASWLYHRHVLDVGADRNEPIRSYDYLLMGAALVTAVVGVALVTSGLISERALDKNQTIAGVTFLLLGAPVWSTLWSSTNEACRTGVGELGSQVRRSYLYLAIGAGALTALIAGIGALQGILEQALDGQLGIATIREHSEALATTAVVCGALWLHARRLAHDRATAARRFGTVDDDGQLLIPFG